MVLAKDLSHLLSEEAKARRPSPLKTCIKYFNDPNIIFLGGGLPLSDYFPWFDISGTSPKPPFANGIGAPLNEQELINFKIPRDKIDVAVDEEFGTISLDKALQYGFSQGHPQLRNFFIEHNKIIHKMDKYEDHEVLATIGNTWNLESALRCLCDKGDYILVEQYAFSSTLAAAEAQGVKTCPIPMDADGIIPEKLEELLAKWDEKKLGKIKFLILVATGSNPKGLSLPEDRRQKVYELACKYDFIIIEDEPYYFLQTGQYYAAEDRPALSDEKVPHDQFVNGLVKSFLSLDTEGRVLRFDSLSKVMGPNTRIGWISGQKNLLAELLKFHEVSIQSPSGFSQSIVAKTLNEWGQEGFLDWLIGVRKEYTIKRDFCIDSLYKHIPKKLLDDKTVVVNPPIAGMFFTIDINPEAHSEFKSKYEGNAKLFEQHLFEKVIKEGVLMVPGAWFEAKDYTVTDKGGIEEPKKEIFFRGTYAAVGLDKLDQGIERFAKVLESEFS
ncbi:hypothetical protein QEN19_000067 [Hanseniaspora menglaensis]